MSKFKTYVLEEHLAPTAPIYIRINKGQRQRIDKIPVYRPYLTYTFSDENMEQKTIRLKLNSNSIDLHEQIAKNIPANAKFTMAERDAAKFKNGVLMTNIKIVQDYLEATPEFNGFKGSHPTIKRPSYRLYDKGLEIVSTNKSFKANLEAANKIAGLTLKQAQDLLYKIYGTHYEVPKIDGKEGYDEEQALAAAQNLLVDYMDTGDEAVAEINGEKFDYENEIRVLIGRLIGDKKLTFIDVEGKVAKKKGNDWIPVMDSPTSLSADERIDQFVNFLSSKSGSNLLADLKNLAK